VDDHEARIAKQNASVVQVKADEAADQFIEAVANPAPAHGRRRTRIG
jgi:predicted RNA-binding protein with PIN domain